MAYESLWSPKKCSVRFVDLALIWKGRHAVIMEPCLSKFCPRCDSSLQGHSRVIEARFVHEIH